MKEIDLSEIPKYIGQTFNSLTVIGRGPNVRNGVGRSKAQAELLCICGNTTYSPLKEVRAGRKKSCGCKIGNNVRKIIAHGTEVNGITIGDEVTSEKRRLFTAICHCGGSFKTSLTSINKKTVKSCGCIGKLKRDTDALNKLNDEYKHTNFTIEEYSKGRVTYRCKCGYSNITQLKSFRKKINTECIKCSKNTRESKVDRDLQSLRGVYVNVRRRCENIDAKDYRSYGAKGICVCEEWKEFVNFFSWCKNNGYKKGLEIDREDPEGGYCPENCRFVTPDQNKLRASSIMLSIQDVIFIRSNKFKWEIHRQFYKCADKTLKNIINNKTFKKVTLDNYDEKGNYRF